MVKVENGKCEFGFGTGSINIVAGYMKKDKKGVIAFRNQEARKIGVDNGDIPSGSLDDYVAVMQFEKSESIDALIYALQEAKNYMQYKRARCIYFKEGYCNKIKKFIGHLAQEIKGEELCETCKSYCEEQEEKENEK